MVKSICNYCTLVWMFCSLTSNNVWLLRVILNDHTRDFEKLLQNNNDISKYHRNIQI